MNCYLREHVSYDNYQNMQRLALHNEKAARAEEGLYKPFKLNSRLEFKAWYQENCEERVNKFLGDLNIIKIGEDHD